MQDLQLCYLSCDPATSFSNFDYGAKLFFDALLLLSKWLQRPPSLLRHSVNLPCEPLEFISYHIGSPRAAYRHAHQGRPFSQLLTFGEAANPTPVTASFLRAS